MDFKHLILSMELFINLLNPIYHEKDVPDPDFVIKHVVL